MNFAFSEEQEELRRAVRRFLQDKSPESEVRRLMDTTEGYDPAVWSQMADQLGLQSLTIPEEYGGAGFGYVELIVVLEEMGSALLCAPYFSTVALAANALLTSGDEAAKKQLLPGLASGESIGTLAITEDSGRWEVDAVALAASRSGDDWVLDGHKSFVLDGHVADLVLVAARSDKGVSLFGVKGDADGLRRTPLPTLDQTRKQARLEFEHTPAWLIGTEGGAEHVDHRGFVGPDVLDLDTQTPACVGAHAGQEDVGRRHQPGQQRPPVGVAQVDRHRRLAPVGGLEVGVDAPVDGMEPCGHERPVRVALGGMLDLDHLGPPLGHDRAGHGHVDMRGDLEGADTGEGRVHPAAQRANNDGGSPMLRGPRNSTRPPGPSSRPRPDSLNPPNGPSGDGGGGPSAAGGVQSRPGTVRSSRRTSKRRRRTGPCREGSTSSSSRNRSSTAGAVPASGAGPAGCAGDATTRQASGAVTPSRPEGHPRGTSGAPAEPGGAARRGSPGPRAPLGRGPQGLRTCRWG